MREMKCRAWDKEEKKMIYDGTCDCSTDGIDYTSLKIGFNGKIQGFLGDDGGKNGLHEHDADIQIDRFILMQFTGLCDKKGKEGCHKDICRIPRDHSWALFNQKKPMIATIEWDRGCFYLMCFLNGVERYCSIENLKYSEIIGDVFQNKDLMEKKS